LKIDDCRLLIESQNEQVLGFDSEINNQQSAINNQQSTIFLRHNMQKAVSTYLFVKERLHPGILDGLARSGVQAVEIFAARQHLDYANRKAHVKEIADWFRGSGIPLNSVHSPLYADYEWGRAGAPPVNIASTERAGRIEAMDEIKRALEIAEQIPFRFLVQHLGAPNEDFSDKKFEAAMTSIEHLRAFAKPLGVRILLENIPNELSTPDRLVEMIRSAHFDDVGVCFDFGHAHMMGSVSEGFEILRNHICSTHVHDNDKMKDSHLWPGQGTIDWKQAMDLLRSAPQTPPLLLELGEDEKVNALEKLGATFDKLEGA
jgi:sugar phosphate isomerase/epimerase